MSKFKIKKETSSLEEFYFERSNAMAQLIGRLQGSLCSIASGIFDDKERTQTYAKLKYKESEEIWNEIIEIKISYLKKS